MTGFGEGSNVQQEPLRETRFYKKKGKCWAVFHDDKGFTSYELWDNLYREFQKWLKAEMKPTGERGVYQSDAKTQDKIRKMLKDHLSFPL